MKRRQLLMLAGGAATTTVVMGATAPSAQAFLPLLIRFAIGQGARQALRKRRLKLEGNKSHANKLHLKSRRLSNGSTPRQTQRNPSREKS
jgi:hypothetical protein